MARVKSGQTTRRRKKKTFRIAKGSYMSKRSRWRQVVQQVERSLRFAYVGRKDRKGGLSLALDHPHQWPPPVFAA